VEPVPTLLLTERVAAECSLHPDDVEFLLAGHRRHVQLLPTRQAGVYRLTPAGYAGVLVTPHSRLVLRPKIPIRNVFYLLEPLADVPVAADATAAVPGTEALDFLAARLVRLLEERAAAGLHRAYAERAEQGPFLQGRLDLPAHLRDPHGRKDQLHSRFEDLSVDVPCNQVPRATAELLLRSALLGDALRDALRRCLRDFAAVRGVALTPDLFAAATADRLAAAYRPLLDLCRLLADSLSPGETAGAIPCPAFLLDMERVFERYVTRGLVQAFAAGTRYTVSVQPTFTASPSRPGRPDVAMRPDVLIERASRRVLVVDAKWKRLPQAALVTDDLYQVLAYATALGVPHAVLVYPGRHDRAWEYDFPGSHVRVTVRTLRVVGPGEACASSLCRLGRALRRDAR